MLNFNWKPANPVFPSLGWVARTKHDGIDVEVRATPSGPYPQFCPCRPGDCVQPGVPYVNVSAMAFMPMVTIGCGTQVDLVEYCKDVHTAGGTEDKPGDVVNQAAASLMEAITAEARQALAELVRHAARLGITPDKNGAS